MPLDAFDIPAVTFQEFFFTVTGPVPNSNLYGINQEYMEMVCF